MSPKEQRKIRLLKGLVFVMSILIVVGIAVVVSTIAYRVFHGQSILNTGVEKEKSTGAGRGDMGY